MSSAAMKLAMTFTAIDAASSVAMALEKRILRLGTAGQKVKKDFEDMVSHTRAGLKSLAATKYFFDIMKPGVTAAANLQEEMLNVKMNIASSAKNVEELNSQLKAVEETAISVAANQPFTAAQVAENANELLKANIKINDVIGERGAAWASSGLSALSKMDPSETAMQLGMVSEAFKIRGGDQFKAFADWMSKVDDASSTKIPRLFYGLMRAGTGMQSLRVDVKDAVTALGILAPLGEEAGTALGRFTERLKGMTPQAIKAFKKAGIDIGKDLFPGGKFVGFQKAVDLIIDKFSKIKDERLRGLLIHKAFGEEGGRAAEAFINAFLTEGKHFGDYTKEYASGLPMESKLDIWGEGLKASWKKLTTTVETTSGVLFKPMLGPLSQAADYVNQMVSGFQKMSKNKPAIPQIVSGSAAAAVGIGGSYAAYRLLRGGLAGRRMLSGLLRGVGSTAVGVAEGKALEKIAGVTPVFVVGGHLDDMPLNAAGGSSVPVVSRKPTLSDQFGRTIETGVTAGVSATAATGGLASLAVAGAAAAIPSVVAGAAWASTEIGKAIAESHAKYYSTDQLSRMRSENMVMGGGPGSSQVRVIDEELARRIENIKLPEVKNEIKLNIHVDQAGKVTSESSDLNTRTEINLSRGDFMGP